MPVGALVGVLFDTLAHILGIVVGLWILGQWAKFMNMRVGGMKIGTWIGGAFITLVLSWIVLLY